MLASSPYSQRMSLVPSWTGREALLAATGHHPFARLTPGGDEVRGYVQNSVIVWTVGARANAFGDPIRAAAICADLVDLDRLDLPRLAKSDAARNLPVIRQEDWEFRWTHTAPSVRDLEARVVPLSPAHHQAISHVLDEVLSYTLNRPGDPRIRRWYGIFEKERLVAVGAERSHNAVGYVAGVAVSAERQGRGYGAAITAALTRALLAEFGVCALGIMDHNIRAQATFEHLGYRDRLARSAIWV